MKFEVEFSGEDENYLKNQAEKSGMTVENFVHWIIHYKRIIETQNMTFTTTVFNGATWNVPATTTASAPITWYNFPSGGSIGS